MIPASLSKYLVRRQYGRFQARVDPLRIRFVHKSADWPDYVRKWPFVVCPGNWDQSDQDIPPFREEQMRQLFVEGLPYSETEVFRRLVSELRQAGETRFPRCRSMEEIDAYFSSVQELYKSMEARGCLAPGDVGAPHDGITVRVGRDGTLIKCNQGTHRLAIARVLRLPEVPVIVDLVHSGWAKRMVRNSFAPGWKELENAIQALRQ